MALAAVGWSDGQLTQAGADAIVRTALEEGLELEEIAEIEEATKHPIDLGIIDRSNMSKADRLFVYAIAFWMSGLDGKVSQEELAALGRLGDLLKIPAKPREHTEAIVREVSELEEGDRPDRFDLKRLRDTILERLEEARKARGLE
jgi:uncharacterized membrane protein YebE (DUF533 family)